MPQICKCCSHPDREKIDELLIKGVPNRRIAAQFSLKEQSVRRHKAHCVPDKIQKSQRLRELAHADALAQRIAQLLEEAESLLGELKKKGDLRGAVSSLGELRRIIEMLSRVGADLVEKQETNIHQDPGWAYIRTAVLDSLNEYPEARASVISALEGILNEL
jgi:uncharacterized small protein (DUF1192 family)